MRVLLLACAILCTSCLATSGDLRGVANKIDAGATVPEALRAQADDMDAQPAGILQGLGIAGGGLGVIALNLLAVYMNDKKRDRRRVKRGEPTGTTPAEEKSA